MRTLEDLDSAFQASVSRRQVRELASCAFIERRENLIFLGPPGVGKSHLPVTLGLEAAKRRLKVTLSKQWGKMRMQLGSGEGRHHPFDSSNDGIFGALAAKELVEVLRATNTLRNETRGHGGAAIGHARELWTLRELQRMVNTVRNLLGDSLLSYRLIRSLQSEFEAGIYEWRVLPMMGTRSVFKSTTIKLREPLERGSMYPYAPGSEYALRLCPLIEVTSEGEAGHAVCRFYSRRTRKGIDWVSLHDPEGSKKAVSSWATHESLDLFL